MKSLSIAVAVITALTLGSLATAQAQSKGRRNGGHEQRQATLQHRASPRNFQRRVNRRQDQQHARMRQGRQSGSLNRKELSRLQRNQHAIGKLKRRLGADGYYSRHERTIVRGGLDHSSQRIRRMKRNPRRLLPRYRHRGHYRRLHGPIHRPHGYYRPVKRFYPVYESSPSHSLGLEVETEDFRFSVHESG